MKFDRVASDSSGGEGLRCSHRRLVAQVRHDLRARATVGVVSDKSETDSRSDPSALATSEQAPNVPVGTRDLGETGQAKSGRGKRLTRWWALGGGSWNVCRLPPARLKAIFRGFISRFFSSWKPWRRTMSLETRRGFGSWRWSACGALAAVQWFLPCWVDHEKFWNGAGWLVGGVI